MGTIYEACIYIYIYIYIGDILFLLELSVRLSVCPSQIVSAPKQFSHKKDFEKLATNVHYIKMKLLDQGHILRLNLIRLLPS